MATQEVAHSVPDKFRTRSLGAGMCVVGSDGEGYKLVRGAGERQIALSGDTLERAYYNAAMGMLGERDWDAVFHQPMPPAEPRQDREGFVYFIAGEKGPIKIGFAVNPALRVRDLQCGSPIPLKVLAEVKGSMKLELQYHRRFAAIRAHGEWFERTPELLAEIERLTVIS